MKTPDHLVTAMEAVLKSATPYNDVESVVSTATLDALKQIVENAHAYRPRTLQRAAETALFAQDACNLSGVLATCKDIVHETIWPAAREIGKGTDWVNQHPIVTMFLLKLCELNGCGSTLHESYDPAEKACKDLAVGEVKEPQNGTHAVPVEINPQ